MSLKLKNKLFTITHGSAMKPYLLPFIPEDINTLQDMFLDFSKKVRNEKLHFIWTPNGPHPMNGKHNPDVANVKIEHPKMQI